MFLSVRDFFKAIEQSDPEFLSNKDKFLLALASLSGSSFTMEQSGTRYVVINRFGKEKNLLHELQHIADRICNVIEETDANTAHVNTKKGMISMAITWAASFGSLAVKEVAPEPVYLGLFALTFLSAVQAFYYHKQYSRINLEQRAIDAEKRLEK